MGAQGSCCKFSSTHCDSQPQLKKGEVLTGGFAVRSTAEKTDRNRREKRRRRAAPALVSCLPFSFVSFLAPLPSCPRRSLSLDGFAVARSLPGRPQVRRRKIKTHDFVRGFLRFSSTRSCCGCRCCCHHMSDIIAEITRPISPHTLLPHFKTT